MGANGTKRLPREGVGVGRWEEAVEVGRGVLGGEGEERRGVGVEDREGVEELEKVGEGAENGGFGGGGKTFGKAGCEFEDGRASTDV